MNIVKAQKANQVQSGNFWLTACKLDGNLGEWPIPLKAYNHMMKMSYSLANDDKFIYLAVSTNRAGKLAVGGLSFVLKRDDGTEGQIIFPYNPLHDRTKIEFFKRGVPSSIDGFELIEVSGISSIKDSVISIYNEYEIQVGIKSTTKDSKYYKKGEDFIEYELAIPLDLLGLSLTGNKRLSYQLKLRGQKVVGNPIKEIMVPELMAKLRPDVSKAELMADYEKQVDVFSLTELSGEYILCSKP